jgi:formylglycine-generating enzyme required for sulfatase activity
MTTPKPFAAIALKAFVLAFAISAVGADDTQSASPKTIKNTLGMKLVLVPAGEFLMGSDESPESLAKAFPQYDPERFAKLGDEGPVHKVRITKPFFMGQHEVTVGQWRKYLEASGYTPESEADGTGGYGYNPDYDAAKTERGDAFEGRDPKYSWKNPGFKQTDDHPVTNVTWNDAVALCRWLSEKEGKRYRLPTEAEWEYACRAGTRTRYSSGDDPASLATVANVFDADAKRNWTKWMWDKFALEAHDGFEFTAPVGSFKPNAFGLYDMHGNVWEWCADFHSDTYYAESPENDPPGPATGKVRVRRGGSWHTWPFYARSSFRNWNSPRTRYTLVGMRVVREE